MICPDEVIIILKPSGDGSEDVIKTFSKEIPIKLITQSNGFIAKAEEMGIRNSSGDIIIFMDDDAIAEERFVAKYIGLFEKYVDAGGIGGITFEARINGNTIKKMTNEYVPSPKLRNYIPEYCKPLKIFMGYHGWISKSGFLFSIKDLKKGILRDGLLSGVNMGFSRRLIRDCPLGRLFRKSRKGYSWEAILSYWVRAKGFHTYTILDEDLAPTVWHIVHREYRLTASRSFWDKFWFSYDVLKNYHRYKALKADVSLKDYFLASIAFLRKDLPARSLAFLYTLLDL